MPPHLPRAVRYAIPPSRDVSAALNCCYHLAMRGVYQNAGHEGMSGRRSQARKGREMYDEDAGWQELLDYLDSLTPDARDRFFEISDKLQAGELKRVPLPDGGALLVDPNCPDCQH
jgi:hypothetical protein